MSDQNVKIGFYGGVGSVTGANFLFEAGGKRVLVDCGMQQGSAEASRANYVDFAYDPASIDVLLVTHAHMDHIGRIPKLVRDGFRGEIYSIKPTRDIAEVMFADAVRLLAHEAREQKLPTPLYEAKDVKQAMKQWQTHPYHEALKLTGAVTVTMHDAGHILGSAMIKIAYGGENFVFTGDLGNTPAPLLRDTEAIDDADYLIMESVYGNRNHEEREFRSEKLRHLLTDSIERGGTMVIPAFSVERTQELLYEMNDMVEGQKIPRVNIFLDSPLAIKVTEIYRNATEYFKPETQAIIKSGDDIFAFPGLEMTETVDESKTINHSPNPKIVIAGSGMSTGGRVLHHELRYLSDPNNTLLFIGYQAAGTLGRIIQDGAKRVKIYQDEIPVKARIETISGYSGHKQMDDLIDFVADSRTRLKKVWCVMGELSSSMFLAQRLRDYLNVKAVVPQQGEVVEIGV